MDTEMTCYESFAEVTEDFYCSAVDVLKILVLRLHDYHARCFHSLRDALYDYFSTDAAPHTHANVSTKHRGFHGILSGMVQTKKLQVPYRYRSQDLSACTGGRGYFSEMRKYEDADHAGL